MRRALSLALLAAVLGAPSAALERLPDPDLTATDPEVREQLREARSAVDELAASPEIDREALAEASGRLGQLYLIYELLEVARAAFANAIELAPDDSRWPYYRGVVHYKQGRLEQAAGDFLALLRLRPNDLPGLVRLGQTLLELSRLEEAEARFARALELEPGHGAALYGLGRIAFLRGDFAAAVERFQAVIATQPDASTAHYQLGLAYRELGEVDLARRHLALQGRQEVRFHDPKMAALAPLARGAGIQIVRATAARARGDLAGAVAGFRAALATDPDEISARMALASTYLQMGDPGAAADEFREVLRRRPDDASALYNLGTLLARQGDREGAREHLEQAVRVAPDYLNARVNLAGLLASEGRLAEAADHLRSVLELDPGDREARVLYGRALARMGQTRDALAELDRVLETWPDSPDALLSRGEILERAGRADEALNSWARLLSNEVSDPELRGRAALRSGLLQAGRGRSEDAVRLLAQAAELLPEAVEAQLALARQLGATGRYGEAADRFARAEALQPGSAEIRFGRALALLLAERYPEARQHLEESVRQLPDDLTLRNTLARLLAAAPEPAVRDGARALTLAQEVVQAELRIDHAETVAMALAELGRFDEAIGIQGRVLEQAERIGASRDAARLRANLERYRQGLPVRAPWLD